MENLTICVVIRANKIWIGSVSINNANKFIIIELALYQTWINCVNKSINIGILA